MEATAYLCNLPQPPPSRYSGAKSSALFKWSTSSTAASRPFVSAAIAKGAPQISVQDPYLHQSPSPSSGISPLKKLSSDSLVYDSGYLGAVPDTASSATAGAEMEGGPSAMSYLTNILSSKVYDVAIESPLQLAPKLSDRLGVEVWLKREDLQPVFSFKLRGAYNMMAKLSREQLDGGVICSSAGNHAQGVALAAQKLNCDAVIAMPVATPEIKWKSVERLGATVVLVGDSYDEAEAYAKQRAKQEGRVFIPPFDHPDVIMGQGTIGMEIVRQLHGPLHAIFVPVGGGGLIAGIAAYVKRVRPEVKIVGVEPFDANAMALSLYHGQRIMLEQVGGFADGVAVKVVGEETFRICRELVDGVVLVSRDAICASIKGMFEEKRSILEPAGALALAGAEAYCKYYGLKGEAVVAITSGANMNFDRLRLVTELADVGRQREAVLATFMPEEKGSFKRFCELRAPRSLHWHQSNKDANWDCESVTDTINELKGMVDRMKSSQLRTVDLTNDDLVKDHLRHLMGGRSNVEDEVLCRFIFPERPGALVKFLDAFSPQWNISLFHYRAQGDIGANVLVGIQVPVIEMNEFRRRANNLGYECMIEMQNEALHPQVSFPPFPVILGPLSAYLSIAPSPQLLAPMPLEGGFG
ncbi:Threonine dehydratase biosynthetic, chloroplastic [Asimina triloba]